MKIRITRKIERSRSVLKREDRKNRDSKRKNRKYGKTPKPSSDDPPTKNH